MDSPASPGPPSEHHVTVEAGKSVQDLLMWHEQNSEKRYECLLEAVEHGTKEHHMGKAEEIHVHNVGSGDGGNGGLGLAALAALSNRGQGNDMAPLALASLMHRSGNDDHRRHHDDWGGHAGLAGAGGLAGAALGFVAGALVNGGRRGGLFGGGDDGGNCATAGNVANVAFDTTILNGINGLTASVPTTALQSQIAVTQAVNQAALTNLGATSNVKDAVSNAKDAVQNVGSFLNGQISGVKDSVQNLALFLSNQLNTVNQNVSEQGCQTRSAVQLSTQAILERINANTIAELQAELAEARHVGRGHESNLNVTQTVTQVQAQAQQQQQQQQIIGALNGLMCGIHGLTQIAHATNSNIIAGNTGAVATGPQTANPTNIGGVA